MESPTLGEGLTERTPVVEKTRREVEKLRVDEEGEKEKASVGRRVVDMAKGGWSKIRNLLEGKKVTQRDGKVFVEVRSSDGKETAGSDNSLRRIEEEWNEEGEGGEVVVEEEQVVSVDTVSCGSGSTTGQTRGFDFLDGMGREERDQELDEKIDGHRKRKREGEVNEVAVGLYGVTGWKWREREGREEKRWKRTVVEEKDGMGLGRGVGLDSVNMGIPLPENYKLGLEERAGLVNHSGKNKNNFGMNRNALFPGGAGGKYDTRNWISTFTKSGCVVCRDDNGRSNHKGRDGKPSVLVIGDEAVPTVVGYTSGDGEGTGCAWVFKKEHLALNEVSGILKRINDDKRESDKMSGKREHDFFIPSGSKILVGSYVHLRREGLEGYVTDFNNMVREVKNVTGDIGIEVLPVVPVCFEGLDKVGRDLLGGLRMWINWIGEKGGRAEIKELSNTAGRERGGDEVIFLWKPSFLLLQSCQGGEN
jgi:hypothetical protein